MATQPTQIQANKGELQKTTAVMSSLLNGSPTWLHCRRREESILGWYFWAACVGYKLIE